MKQPLITKLTLLTLAVFITACSSEPTEEKTMPKEVSGVMLSNEAIYKNYEYNAKRPGAFRWETEGSNFTALETAKGFEDAELEKDQYGDDIKIYEEIVEYDPATLERSIMISLEQLTPKGQEKALVVDDYKWSKDRSLC